MARLQRDSERFVKWMIDKTDYFSPRIVLAFEAIDEEQLSVLCQFFVKQTKLSARRFFSSREAVQDRSQQ